MNFDELSKVWNGAELDPEENLQFSRKLVKEAGISKIRSSLYEIKWEAIIEVVVGIFFFKFLWGFMIDHITEMQFFIPAFILFNINLFGVLFESYRLYLYFSLRANDSVLGTQIKLARLRYLEFIDAYSLLVVIPLFSAPFFIVIAKAFLHISLYDFNLSWLVSYTIGSAVVAVILMLVIRFFPNKNLTEAIAFMKELKEER